jgi:hypothetical protein
MRLILGLTFILASMTSHGQDVSIEYKPSQYDLQKADEIARKTAAWFEYTTGPMESEYLGQCSDYAVMFILKYNEYAGQNVARLVTANNPVSSGTYRLGEKVDVDKLGSHVYQVDPIDLGKKLMSTSLVFMALSQVLVVF